MSISRFEKYWTAGGLAVAAVAASAALTLGVVPAASAEESGERHSKIKLVVDRDGVAERLTLDDLHELAIGESRTLATEGGRPVTVTRDTEGFAVDIDGKIVRVEDRFGDLEGGGPGEHRFEKRIVVGDGEPGEGDTMVFHGTGNQAGDVVIMKRRSPDGDAFAWSTNGTELPRIPLGIEGTIAQLEQNAKFQALDAATRATVLEALRESAPHRVLLEGGPGRKVMMIEIDDERDGEVEND
jgi:hypothetical protein